MTAGVSVLDVLDDLATEAAFVAPFVRAYRLIRELGAQRALAELLRAVR